jgi:chemotaxis protein CheD
LAGAKLRHVVQGEYAIIAEEGVVLTTILGSCVSACIRDPLTQVGGINHFLLPGDARDASDAVKYGVNAMELLINEILKRGGQRGRMQAKLFGGANVMQGLSDIGAQNAVFAERFLKKEGIVCVGQSLGGDRARRIRYWPLTGRATQQFLAPTDRGVFQAERRKVEPPAPPSAGTVELF